MEIVRFVMEPECVLVDGDTVRNKYWVGLVKCSEEKKIVDFSVDN